MFVNLNKVDLYLMKEKYDTMLKYNLIENKQMQKNIKHLLCKINYWRNYCKTECNYTRFVNKTP